jgi:hypothetical protein
MAKRKYTVTGPFPAYGVNTGESVTLDDSDELVKANIAAGVVTLGEDDSPPPKMTCPACVEAGMKRPPSFASHAELADHYGEKHPALVTPEWEEES